MRRSCRSSRQRRRTVALFPNCFLFGETIAQDLRDAEYFPIRHNIAEISLRYRFPYLSIDAWREIISVNRFNVIPPNISFRNRILLTSFSFQSEIVIFNRPATWPEVADNHNYTRRRYTVDFQRLVRDEHELQPAINPTLSRRVLEFSLSAFYAVYRRLMERRDKKRHRRSTFQRLFVSQSSGLLRNRPLRTKSAFATPRPNEFRRCQRGKSKRHNSGDD